MKEIKYTVNEDFDFVFDEKGNTFLALRKIVWGEKGNEKIDIRKWYNTKDGGETAGKGVTFLTEDGPNELANILVEQGYGDTEHLLKILMEREDIKTPKEKVEKAIDNIKSEMFNPVDSLL